MASETTSEISDIYLTKILDYKLIQKKGTVSFYQKYGQNTIDLLVGESKFEIRHYLKYPTVEQIKDKRRLIKDEEIQMQIAELTAWIDDIATDEIKSEDKMDEEKANDLLISHQEDRELMIYVWGRNNRDWLPAQYGITKNENFNASILTDRHPHGSRLPARKNEDVIKAVMRDKGFWPFMINMIKQIEKKNLSKIGINCRHGKHRSQTCALILQRRYYKKAKIEFVEIGHGG